MRDPFQPGVSVMHDRPLYFPDIFFHQLFRVQSPALQHGIDRRPGQNGALHDGQPGRGGFLRGGQKGSGLLPAFLHDRPPGFFTQYPEKKLIQCGPHFFLVPLYGHLRLPYTIPAGWPSRCA